MNFTCLLWYRGLVDWATITYTVYNLDWSLHESTHREKNRIRWWYWYLSTNELWRSLHGACFVSESFTRETRKRLSINSRCHPFFSFFVLFSYFSQFYNKISLESSKNFLYPSQCQKNSHKQFPTLSSFSQILQSCWEFNWHDEVARHVRSYIILFFITSDSRISKQRKRKKNGHRMNLL